MLIVPLFFNLIFPEVDAFVMDVKGFSLPKDTFICAGLADIFGF